jgi:hypothetical protein
MKNLKFIALSITGALALASCQQPVTPAPVNKAPVAAFTATPTKLVVAVSDASTDPDGIADIASYSWNWGDSTPASTGKTPAAHTYAAGTYTITLTVTDKGGLTNSTTQTVTATATDPNPNPNPDLLPPTTSITSTSKTPTSVTVNFSAAALAGTTLTKCVVTVGTVSKEVAITTNTFSGTATIDGLTAATSYLAKVECFATNGTKEFKGSTSVNVTTADAPVVPNPNGGGNNGVGNGAFDISTAAQIIKTANINKNNQFRFAVIDQKLTNGTITPLLYIRGTFDLSKDMTTLSAARGQTPMPNEGAGIEYYYSNTITNASNKISGKVDTTGGLFNQGQLYQLHARLRNADGSLVDKGSLLIVADNEGPEVPKIVPVSKLQSATLTSTYGNWVNGKFAQQLINASILEDRPQPTGNGSNNPQNAPEKPAAGFAALVYFAYNITGQDLGGDPGQYLPRDGSNNYDLSKAIPLGSVLNNANSIDNFKQDVLTAKKTKDSVLGDGRYVIFAVAFDNLGNANKIDFQDSYILGVDNTPPTGNITVVDRGPLDVNAVGAECTRVDTDAATNKAPSDVMIALPGYVSGCALVSASVSDQGVGFAGAVLSYPAAGTISAPGGLGGFEIRGYDSQSSVRLATTVWNVNSTAGLQVLRGQAADMLGNTGKIYSAPFVIDNRSPSVTMNMNSANGSNTFNAGQSVGVGAEANDNGVTFARTDLDTLNKKIADEVAASIAADKDPESATADSYANGNAGSLGVVSGPRAQNGTDLASLDNFTKNKNIAYYYGTSDLDFNPGTPKAYNNMLMQLSPAYVEDLRDDQIGGLFSSRANFNIPDPANGRGPAASYPLDVWGLAVDSAGNAGVAKRAVDVIQPSKGAANRPVIMDDLGQVEDGQTPGATYQGFTVLPRTSNGNVAQLTHDFADPLDPLATFGLSRLNVPNNRVVEYTNLGTGFYELRVQGGNNDGIKFNGNVNNTQGIGAVSFVYRLPDPINPKVGDTLFGVNPVKYWGIASLVYRTTNGGVYNAGNVPTSGLSYFFDSKSNCENATGVKCALLLSYANNEQRYINAANPVGNNNGTLFGSTLGESDFTDNANDSRGVIYKTFGGVSKPAYYPVIVAHGTTKLENIERKGRFFYNVPGWFGAQGDFSNGSFGAALTPNQRIWSIWNNISDAQKAPFVSVFSGSLKGFAIADDLGASNQNFSPSVGSATPAAPYYKQFAIGVVAFNNYGQADAQAKRE